MPYERPIPKTFAIGEIVQLNSGGDAMTICGFDKQKEQWHCKWFGMTYHNNPALMNAYFPDETLKKYIAPPQTENHPSK